MRIVGGRRVVGAAVAAFALAVSGCGGGTSDPGSVGTPTGWVRHRYGDVSVAAPAGWRVVSARICYPQPTDTVGVLTEDDHSLSDVGVVAIGVASCPSGVPAPASSWVSIECYLARRVLTPDGTTVATTEKHPVLKRTAQGVYVIGQGQADLVVASSDHFGHEVLGTVALDPGQGC
jgi:hypothetical protein